MAKIFRDIFDKKLVTKNDLLKDDLDQLPSPYQLQGKIILKGTEPSSIKPPKKSIVRRNA